jgi:hypothetical protein
LRHCCEGICFAIPAPACAKPSFASSFRRKPESTKSVMPGLEPGIQGPQQRSKLFWIAGIIKLVLGLAKPDPSARQ